MKVVNGYQQLSLASTACTSADLEAAPDSRKKLSGPKRRFKTLWALAVTACVVYSLAQCGRSQGLFASSRFTDGHHLKPSAVLSTLAAEKAWFLQQHAATYGYSGWIDRHWKSEVGDKLGVKLQYYLDYTAAALFTKSHLAAVTQMLSSTTLSNPHSRNPSSARSTQELLDAEQLVLEFFRADPNEYMVVWTRGATDALKMVGEWFPWTPRAGWQPSRRPRVGLASSTDIGPVSPCGPVPASARSTNPGSSHFLYLRANHKSVLGIGCYADEHGATFACVDEEGMEQWLSGNSSSSSGAHQSDLGTGNDRRGSNAALVTPAAAAAGGRRVTFSLVGYPPKDNYEGRLYPLEWIDKIHAKSTAGHRWYVVLDAAAFVATHPLDLSSVHPDFVDISFYKLFGFPTGLGCLIARKESVALLHKPYFGGGTVEDATAEDLWRVFLQGPDAYQDGTKDFLGIPMLQFGFKQIHELGGIKAVEAHVSSLQAWTYSALLRLKHSNGQPIVRLFGRHDVPKHQSAIFQLLVLSPEGAIWSPVQVEKAAAVAGLAIRTGCMCNPGQCYHNMDIRPEERRAAVLAKVDMSNGFFLVNRTVATAPRTRSTPGHAGHHGAASVGVKLPTGSVRVSLGYLSTFEDCYAAARFLLDEYRDVPATLESTNIGHVDHAALSSLITDHSGALQDWQGYAGTGAAAGKHQYQVPQQARRQS